MTAPNYLSQGINGTVRIAFVIAPAVKATSHLLELALRALNVGLGVINVQVKLPEKGQDTYASKFYTYIHDYLPATITTQNDAFNKLSNADIVKGAIFYTVQAIVATYVANKLIGPAPEIYNTVAKYAGSALRLDTGYDVIQMAIDYALRVK